MVSGRTRKKDKDASSMHIHRHRRGENCQSISICTGGHKTLPDVLPASQVHGPSSNREARRLADGRKEETFFKRLSHA